MKRACILCIIYHGMHARTHASQASRQLRARTEHLQVEQEREREPQAKQSKKSG